LTRRFERYPEVLLSHLLLFRFSYPGERDLVPDWVMAELVERSKAENPEPPLPGMLCRGNLLSRINYTVDLQEWGYIDGRAWDEDDRRRETEHGQGTGL
jgi:hypothetical protein